MFAFLSNLVRKIQNSVGIKPSVENFLKKSADEIEKSNSGFSGESIAIKLSSNVKPYQKKSLDLVNVPTGFFSDEVVVKEVRLNRDTSNLEKLERQQRQRFINLLLDGGDRVDFRWKDWITRTLKIGNPLVELCLKEKISSEDAASALDLMKPESYLKEFNDNDNLCFGLSESYENPIKLKNEFLAKVDEARQAKSSLNYRPCDY